VKLATHLGAVQRSRMSGVVSPSNSCINAMHMYSFNCNVHCNLGIREGNFSDFNLLGLDTISSGRHVRCYPHITPRRSALKLKKWIL
jgi:hypothetical protein